MIAAVALHYTFLEQRVVAGRRICIVCLVVVAFGGIEVGSIITGVAKTVVGVGHSIGGKRSRTLHHMGEVCGGIVVALLRETRVAEVVARHRHIGRRGGCAAHIVEQSLGSAIVVGGAVEGFTQSQTRLAGRGFIATRRQGIGSAQQSGSRGSIAGGKHARAQRVENGLLCSKHLGRGIAHAVDARKGAVVVVVGKIAGHHILLHLGGVGAFRIALQKFLKGPYGTAERHPAALHPRHGIIVERGLPHPFVVAHSPGLIKRQKGRLRVAGVHQRLAYV